MFDSLTARRKKEDNKKKELFGLMQKLASFSAVAFCNFIVSEYLLAVICSHADVVRKFITASEDLIRILIACDSSTLKARSS